MKLVKIGSNWFKYVQNRSKFVQTFQNQNVQRLGPESSFQSFLAGKAHFHKGIHNILSSIVKSLQRVPTVSTARLAQSVEHETLNLRVVGSSPTLGDLVLQGSFLRLHYKQTNVLRRHLSKASGYQFRLKMELFFIHWFLESNAYLFIFCTKKRRNNIKSGQGKHAPKIIVLKKFPPWRCRGLNPGPFTCKANALPLRYIPFPVQQISACWISKIFSSWLMVVFPYGQNLRALYSSLPYKNVMVMLVSSKLNAKHLISQINTGNY